MVNLKSQMSILLLVALAAGAARAEAHLTGTNPAQWRLVWRGDPSTSATIAWSTLEEGSTHFVRYRKQRDTDFLKKDCHRSGKYSGYALEGTSYYHHAALEGLDSDTVYEIQLVSDRRTSPRLRFRTAPQEDRPQAILFGGDSRTNRIARRGMNRLMSRLYQESQTSNDATPVVALAHGGDYVVSGRSLIQWSCWMTDHELTMGKDRFLLPIIPARGNHEPGDLFNEVFGFPKPDENYYATHLGPQICLLTLNSNISAGGDQANWLETQLRQKRPKARWVIAQYHKPAYPAVKSPGSALRFWVPLFERFNIDLVCEADGHTIKRTMPIRNGQRDETGIVYVGEGGLGVPQRTPKKDRWYLQSPGMSDRGNHLQVITFTPDTLKCETIFQSGKVRDTYRRKPRSMETRNTSR